MTIRARRTLFYALVLVFIALGAGVALYAQGWRLDFATLSPKKVGAIYVRSEPRDADITLDGKPIKRTNGFFEAGTLINGLFPKSHTLALSREGYRPWQRTLTVTPSKVAEAKYAVMVPEIATDVKVGGVENFWSVVGGEPIIQTASGTLMVDGVTLRGFRVLAVAPDGNRAITENTDKSALYLADLTRATSTNLTTLLSKLGVSQKSAAYSFDAKDSAKIFVSTPRSLTLVDMAKNTSVALTPLAQKTNITAVSAGVSFVAWAASNASETTSTVILYNLSQRTSGAIPLELSGKTIKLAWVRPNLLGMLQSDGGLHLVEVNAPFDPTGLRNGTKKLASDVRDFFPTPNGEKIAALERRSLEVFSLDTKDYWRFNLQEVEQIVSLSWFGEAHNLFLHFPSRVTLLDLDDGLQENITLVAETPNGSYDTDAEKFYFVSGHNLSLLEF
jgi:hypothetical protein